MHLTISTGVGSKNSSKKWVGRAVEFHNFIF